MFLTIFGIIIIAITTSLLLCQLSICCAICAGVQPGLAKRYTVPQLTNSFGFKTAECTNGHFY